MNNIASFFLKRKYIILTLCIVTPLGFLCKSYLGLGRIWFNDYGGDVLYEIFWSLVFFFFIPRKKNAVSIAIAVLVITSILETLQLWHPPFLQQIRTAYWGKVLIGTTFVWWDFPHYILGCSIAWVLMRKLPTHHNIAK